MKIYNCLCHWWAHSHSLELVFFMSFPLLSVSMATYSVSHSRCFIALPPMLRISVSLLYSIKTSFIIPKTCSWKRYSIKTLQYKFLPHILYFYYNIFDVLWIIKMPERISVRCRIRSEKEIAWKLLTCLSKHEHVMKNITFCHVSSNKYGFSMETFLFYFSDITF